MEFVIGHWILIYPPPSSNVGRCMPFHAFAAVICTYPSFQDIQNIRFEPRIENCPIQNYLTSSGNVLNYELYNHNMIVTYLIVSHA